ncbi:YraN family protein [Gemmiger sp. An120]|uniref:YraN family protein n=1 Tax=Gemmiger TaxID=204475 RepID=UPI000B39D5D5|nr:MULTISPECIES: YraN family protein [Gemmiger]MBM6914347.1 YraN family protein [Gemmiger formicilis]OUQ44495.1 YraN family protein [Gemmiger sp. An120]HIX33974.1 YraN family protein [Candidatus Gemmiger avium]
MNSAELGRRGEDAAARWYQKQGFAIVARNFRTRMGELDLVAARGNLLVIAEVKTRSGDAGFGAPAEAVDRHKQQRLIRAAQLFLQRCPEYAEYAVRFDVAEVTPGLLGLRVRCICGAFECE